MDLWDVAKVMWRRRWVAVPLLLLSVVAAVFALLTVPPDYTAKAQIAFLPPTTPVDTSKTGEPGNQFTVDTLAEFGAVSANRPDVHRQLAAEGLSADYEVTMKAFGLTLMDIKVEAKTEALVTATLNRLIELVKADVAKLQSHLKVGQAITIQVIDEGEQITTVRTVGKRTLIVIVGVGLLVTVAISLWVDALVRRRYLRLPDLPAARAVVPVSPAPAPPPVVFSPAATNNNATATRATSNETTTVVGSAAIAVALEDGLPDNDSTVVLPLSGVSWSSKSGKPQGKRNSGGSGSGGSKPR